MGVNGRLRARIAYAHQALALNACRACRGHFERSRARFYRVPLACYEAVGWAVGEHAEQSRAEQSRAVCGCAAAVQSEHGRRG